MKKLMIAAAIAGAVGMAQAAFSDPEGFESPTWALGDKVATTPVGGYRYWNASANDTNEQYEVIETVVTNYAGTGETPLTDAGLNYLALTGVELLERYVLPQNSETETAYDIANDSTTGELYIDTLVKFTVTEDDAPAPGDGDKLCIWVGVNDGATNLMVTAGYIYDMDGHPTATNYVTTLAFDADTINQWHRLVVKTIPAIDSEEYGLLGDGFVVIVDGTAVAIAGAGNAICNELFEQVPEDDTDDDKLNAGANTYYQAKQLFPSLLIGANPNSGKIFSVGFKGSGAIDNLQFSETDPNPSQDGWKDPTDPAAMAEITNKTAAVAYPSLAGTALANADAVKLTLWATDQTKGALAFADAAADNVTTATVEAFLLNCAVADVATEKAEFTVNITWNETDQVWEVTGPSGKTYNGTLTIKGSPDLTTPKANWDAYDPTTDKFMFGVLEF